MDGFVLKIFILFLTWTNTCLFNSNNDFEERIEAEYVDISLKKWKIFNAKIINNDGEYIFSENFFFTYNLKYSIWDNFEDLTYPPVDIGPAEVRTDIKKYLNEYIKTNDRYVFA